MTADAAKRIRVVVVDNDDLVRDALTLILRDPEIEVVAACATADEGLEAVKVHLPQVALVDLHMDGDPGAGVALISDIRRNVPTVSCAVLTATAVNGEYLGLALKAGARGYYRKSYAKGNQLPLIIKHLASGHWDIDPGLADEVQEWLNGHYPEPPGRPLLPERALTPTEWKVFERAVEGRSVDEIAGYLVVERETVRTHLQHIYSKLCVNGQQELIFVVGLRRYLVEALVRSNR